MRIVLDTNVLVSGLIRSGGPPGRIVDLIRAADVQVVVDDRILHEYGDVLRRDELRRWIFAADAATILDFLHHESHRIACRHIARGLPDPSDAPFLEAARSASVALVTGNPRHFPPNVRAGCEVISPREFLDIHISS